MAVLIDTQMNRFAFVISLFNHILAAPRAFFPGRFVPADEIAFRIPFTPVESSVLFAHFDQKALTAFGTGHIKIL
jgi:hypothetical protein